LIAQIVRQAASLRVTKNVKRGDFMDVKRVNRRCRGHRDRNVGRGSDDDRDDGVE
jgi:hypothetical protein